MATDITTDTTTPEADAKTIDVDVARDLVAEALAFYSHGLHGDEAALIKAMSENVRGWTHTTRLRDFLGSVDL